MKAFKTPLILLLISVVILTCSFASAGANKPIAISREQSQRLTRTLQQTLSGNLATVLRSEWKTKLTIQESNHLIYDFVLAFMEPEVAAKVLLGLDVDSEGFTRVLYSRLYALQEAASKAGQAYNQRLAVRDRPAPTGTFDYTFTYYTAALHDETPNSDAKHQIRIRTYLREVNFAELHAGEEVKAFLADGQSISFVRLNQTEFNLLEGSGRAKRVWLSDLESRYGERAYFFAPHGREFKLEDKNALDDEIQSRTYPNLSGQHMVQKLDVTLTPAQVQFLFGPLTSSTDLEQKHESNGRVEIIRNELKARFPDRSTRIDGLLEILTIGIVNRANFLVELGATLYHRSPFESSVGWQFTIDRQQAAFDQDLYDNDRLKSPMQILLTAGALMTHDSDARHDELKFPITALEQLMMLANLDPELQAMLPTTPVDVEGFKQALRIYYNYVKNGDHTGKFHYLIGKLLDTLNARHTFIPLSAASCAAQLAIVWQP